MEVVTPMTTMDVTCPPGCKEGDQVRIQSPAGQVIQVAVPPGVSAGQVFQAHVPAPQQIHQGMPVVQPMGGRHTTSLLFVSARRWILSLLGA